MDILDKIDMYRFTSQEKRNMITLLEMAVFIEEDFNRMNEAFDFMGKIKGLADKIGVHASSSGGGMIGILYKSGKVMAEFMWNAMKASMGDTTAKERVKELAKTEISKEDVLDFLLRLDGLTLHTMTGPIHFIDNLTGWHIWAAVKKHAENFGDIAAKAIKDLAGVIKDTDAEVKTKAKSLLHGIVRVLGLEDTQQKVVQAI